MYVCIIHIYIDSTNYIPYPLYPYDVHKNHPRSTVIPYSWYSGVTIVYLFQPYKIRIVIYLNQLSYPTIVSQFFMFHHV